MSQRIVVLETNEVPLRIFRRFQKLRPGSNLDRLLQKSHVVETMALDVDESLLYPSQTWASLNTGAPYEAHKIHWYNDPKPDQYPLYWKTVADRGLTVGLVNTLHSSPAEPYAAGNDNFKFVIPDCFAADSYTKPGYFEAYQKLTLKAVSANARVATMKAPIQEAALTLINSPRYGIRAHTMIEGASLLAQIARKKVNRERIRNMQFPLAADVFVKLFRKHQPNLSIIFTNHVAANMHRYWYGLFPEDYPTRVYDEKWINKYRDEIMAAVDLLDNYLGELMKLAEKNDCVLVVVSSMGQAANEKLTPEVRASRTHSFRLEDVRKFADQLVSRRYSYNVEQAMVPQYMLGFPSTAEAENYGAEVRESIPGLKSASVTCDVNGPVVTLSVTLDGNASEVIVRGKSWDYKALGFTRFEIDDHSSGRHCPEGSLIIYNSKTAKVNKPTVNYLEYAPAMLKHFGIERQAFMTEPSFNF
jgi:hypothetical protein